MTVTAASSVTWASVASVSVAGVSYGVGDIFVLDGRKVTVMEI